MTNPGLKFAPRDSRKNRSRTASYHFFSNWLKGVRLLVPNLGGRGAYGVSGGGGFMLLKKACEKNFCFNIFIKILFPSITVNWITVLLILLMTISVCTNKTINCSGIQLLLDLNYDSFIDLYICIQSESFHIQGVIKYCVFP